MRRRLGLLLLAVGLVATVIGTASGCGAFFSFNGRHPVAVHAFTPGTPLFDGLQGKAGRRYTLAVQVVFDRADLDEANGALLVDARFPLVASLEDAKAVGWLDPNEPPTVLYGQSTNPNVRRPQGAGGTPGGVPELVAERLIGPFLAPADREIRYSVELGSDRVGKARVKEVRVVVYDDRLPPSVILAFGAAGGGVLALVSGSIVLLFGALRARRGGARRPRNV